MDISLWLSQAQTPSAIAHWRTQHPPSQLPQHSTFYEALVGLHSLLSLSYAKLFVASGPLHMLCCLTGPALLQIFGVTGCQLPFRSQLTCPLSAMSLLPHTEGPPGFRVMILIKIYNYPTCLLLPCSLGPRSHFFL